MRKERSLMFTEELILKTETSLYGTNITESTSNGMSFMLMNTQRNQRRENSMKNSDSMLKEPFYIISQLDENRYLDLINNRNMVIKTQNGRNTQIWYFHQYSKTIRTKLNNQSFDIQNSGKTGNMQIWSTNSGWW
jgi:hypothetical protein